MKTWGMVLIALGACGVLAVPLLVGTAGFGAVMFLLIPAAVLVLAGVALILTARDQVTRRG